MLLIVQISDYGHSSGYKVIPHCDFDSHFLRSNDAGIFSCSYWSFVVHILWKNVYSDIFTTFKLGFFYCCVIKMT